MILSESKAFFKSIKNGLPTRMVLGNVLNSTGAWTQENDKEIEDIEKQISLLLAKDVKGREKQKVADKANELEEKVSNLRRMRNSYFSHCAEAVASDAQRDFLVACTTSYADSGEKVWDNYEKFLDEEDGAVLFRATYEYLMFSNDVPSNLPNEEEDKAKDEKDTTATTPTPSDKDEPKEVVQVEEIKPNPEEKAE